MTVCGTWFKPKRPWDGLSFKSIRPQVDGLVDLLVSGLYLGPPYPWATEEGRQLLRLPGTLIPGVVFLEMGLPYRTREIACQRDYVLVSSDVHVTRCPVVPFAPKSCTSPSLPYMRWLYPPVRSNSTANGGSCDLWQMGPASPDPQ